MKSFVFDASIILNYLFAESKDVKILLTKILKQAQANQVKLLSTSFLSIEVANGLRFKLKDSELAQRVLLGFMALPINYHQLSDSQLLQTTKSAYAMGTTIYDTAYHILAISHGATFLTCDNKYYKQARKLGDIKLYGQSK